MFVSIPYPPPDDEDESVPPRQLEWLCRAVAIIFNFIK